MGFFEELNIKNQLAGLRKKWLVYKKKGDEIMCGVILRQARSLEKVKKTEKK